MHPIHDRESGNYLSDWGMGVLNGDENALRGDQGVGVLHRTMKNSEMFPLYPIILSGGAIQINFIVRGGEWRG